MLDNVPMVENELYLPEVLFEFVIQGRFVKVMAIDPITRTEVSIVGDARTSRDGLEKLATKKLKMVIKKKNKKDKKQMRDKEENYY